MDQEKLRDLFQDIEQINSRMEPIILQNQDMRRIIILGPTGSGKSTLANILTNKEVHVTLYDQCIIQLEGENIGEGSRSITRFPHTALNDNLTNIFCDCPGFFDTDGILQEIKNAFTINLLLQKNENFDSKIKILITISFPDILSARSIMVEQTFKIFENMIKINDEYKNGIGLIITKTPEDIIPSACLNLLKKNSNEFISSWCNFFLQNNCSNVFLFPTPSKNYANTLYNNFPDKARLEEFLNNDQIDIVNPHHEVGLSENAKNNLISIASSELVSLNYETIRLFSILRELFNRENNIYALNYYLNAFNDIDNEEFTTINEFKLLIPEEIQIDQSEYDFSNIQKHEKVCQFSGIILNDDNFKNCVRNAIINQLPQFRVQINTDLRNKIQNENIRQQNQQIQQQMNSVNNQNENLRQQVYTLNNHRQRMQEQMNSVNNQNENLRRQVNNMNKHNQKLQEEQELLKDKNNELENNICNMKKEHSTEIFSNGLSLATGFIGFLVGGPAVAVGAAIGSKIGTKIAEKIEENENSDYSH